MAGPGPVDALSVSGAVAPLEPPLIPLSVQLSDALLSMTEAIALVARRHRRFPAGRPAFGQPLPPKGRGFAPAGAGAVLM
jgi:hypothetical protein